MSNQRNSKAEENQTEAEKDPPGQTDRTAMSVDDRLVRLIGIPFFGTVIPSATGLLDIGADPWTFLLIGFAYFILTAWGIWEGNRYLLFRFYPQIQASHTIAQKYLLMTGLNIFYTTPVILLSMWLWSITVSDRAIPGDMVLLTTIITVVCVMFVTNVYEKALFTKQIDIDRMRGEQLERARLQAELEALKNQVDPHFMFNALNTISYLVDHEQDKAREFVDSLADVYRYILKSKDKNLVMLEEECSFAHTYTQLMELRYGPAFSVNWDERIDDAGNLLIPPVSLMVAVENAAKHNEVSTQYPLTVEIALRDMQLQVRNKMQARRTARPSTKLGLKNLAERYEKTVGRSVSVVEDHGYFTLTMPLIKMEH